MGNIYFSKSGISPQGGAANVLYTDASLYQDGTTRLKSSRQNATFDVIFTTIGDTVPDVKSAELIIGLYETRAKLYWEQKIGEKPIFRYRVADGLRHLPDPLIGEWAEYYVIKEVNLRRPSSWGDLRPAGVTEKIIAQLVCEPAGKGNPQFAGWTSTFFQDPLGRFWLSSNKNNILINPSFAHPTNRLHSWNLTEYLGSSSVVHYMDTDDFFSGDASLVLVTDSNKPAFYLLPSGSLLSGTAGAGWILKRTDGGPVDDTVVQLRIDNANVANQWFRQIPGTDWWMALGTSTGVTSGTADLMVHPGQAIKVDYAWFGTVSDAGRLYSFLPLDCDTPGGRHNSVGNVAYQQTVAFSRPSFLKYPVPKIDFVRDFTLSFKATILGEASAAQDVANTDFVSGAEDYYASAPNNMILRFNGTTSRWEYHRYLDGRWFIATSSQVTIVWGSQLHIIITHIGNTARVYIEGVLIITLSNLPPAPQVFDYSSPHLDKQVLAFNGEGGFCWAVDGIKYFATGLSASEVAILTSNEAVTGQIQAPFYVATQSAALQSPSIQASFEANGFEGGDNRITAVNGLMIGNVPGNDAAEYEVKLSPNNIEFYERLYLYGVTVDAPPSFTQLRAFSEKFNAASSIAYSMGSYTPAPVPVNSRQRFYPAAYDWLKRFRKNVKGEFLPILIGRVEDNITLEVLITQYSRLQGSVTVNASSAATRQGKKTFGVTPNATGAHMLAETYLPEDRSADNQRVALEVITGDYSSNNTVLDTLYLLPLDNMAKLVYQPDEVQADLPIDSFRYAPYFHLNPQNCWLKSYTDFGHPDLNSYVVHTFRYEYEFGEQPKIWPGYVNFLCLLLDPESGNYQYASDFSIFDFIVTPRYI